MAGEIKLNLNDFKAVLGRVNDGDVRVDGEGNLKKINYGGKFTRFFRSTVTPSAEENRAIRQAFMSAILGSREGKTLTQAKIDEIRRDLGLAVGEGPEDAALLGSKLDRHMIAQVMLDVTGGAFGDGRYAEIVREDGEMLIDRGVCTRDEINAAKAYVLADRDFDTAESMAEFAERQTPRKLFGFSRSEIVKFVKNNAALVKEMVFVRACYAQRDARAAEGGPDAALAARKPRTLFFAGVRDLMQAYAKHNEAKLNFRGIVPTPPGVDMDSVQPLPVDPQLAGFQSQLDAFDGFVDAMFERKVPEGGRPLSVDDLRTTRANVVVKHEIRQILLNTLALCQNNPQQALEHADLKPLRGLLSLSAEVAGKLTPVAKNVLCNRFFSAVADASHAGGPNEFREIMSGLAKVLKSVSDAVDTEATLREAFARTGFDQSRYGTLRAELMPNGVLAQPCRTSVNLVVDARLAEICDRLEHPEAAPDDRPVARESLDALAEAFRAASDRLAEGADARKALIEGFCHDTDVNKFPACLNDDDPHHKVFRSKVHLMGQVLTKEQCREAGLVRGPGDWKCLKFPTLENSGLQKGEFTKAKLEERGLWDAFEKEVAAYEKKIDDLLKHVSALEIRARKEYYALEGDVMEISYGHGRTALLDAMRDHLMPENLTREVFATFSMMFYGGVPEKDPYDVERFHASQIPSVETMKVEWDIRLAQLKFEYPDLAETAETQLTEKLRTIEETDYPDNEDRTKAIRMAYVTAIDDLHVDQEYRGFGSTDVMSVFRLLDRCDISVARLTPNFVRGEDGKLVPPDLDRAIALMSLIRLRGGSAKGIVEWFERVSGKPITELSREAVLELQMKGIVDPLDSVAEKTALGKTVRFLKGEYSLAQSGLDKTERIRLSQALDALSKRLAGDLSQASSKEVTIGGVAVKLSVDVRSRQLVGTVNVKERDLPIACPFDVGNLNAQLQNDIIANLDAYLASPEDKQILLGIIPDEAAAANNVSRARELCTRVIAKITGRSTVDFAALTMDELRATAKGLVNGTVAKESVHPEVSQSYNSREAIELGTSMLADEATMRKISWSTVVDPLPPPETREGRLPTPATIRDFAADLVMNKNSWVFDVESGSAPGTRILKLLKGYAPEVRYLLAHPEALDVLPAGVKESVAGILGEVRQLSPDIANPGALENLDLANGDVATKMAALDDRVRTMMTSTMASLQTKITNLFVGQQGVATETWKRTSADINGTGGLDVTTPQGKFIKDVLDKYFKESSEIDQRAMLSAFIRNTAPGDSDGKLAGELIKGAGPLLQKMLQGLPVETFPPETQAALQDTRTRLAPIPREVVNARLANMITSSNGFITGIEVKKSLGAASVGQAFLCRIYTKDHPYTGEEVVIKILRPNVETAARREYELISGIARAQGNGMDVAFADRFAGILKEFDFTIEAGNIDRGAVYSHAKIGDEPSGDVEAMGRYQSVLPTTGALVLQKASGQPVSNFTRDARTRFDAILAPIRGQVALERRGRVRETYTVGEKLANVDAKRTELRLLHDEIVAKRKQLEHLVQAWFQQAFEGGFVHGDMHSGNIMSDAGVATIIDFGNCTFLTETERNAVLVGLASCVLGEGVDVDNPSTYLLKCLKTLSTDAGKHRMDEALADKELQKDLKVSLTRGTKLDVVTRMLSSLTLIQNRGYPLPESITVFTQSLSRLQAAITDADTLMSEIEEAADSICASEELRDRYRDPDDPLTRTDGGFRIFRDLDKILLRYSDEGLVPDSERTELLQGMDSNGADLLAEAKRDNRALVEERGGLAFIDLIVRKYGTFEVARESNMGGGEGPGVFFANIIPPYLLNSIEAHRQLVEQGGNPEAIAASRDQVLATLLEKVAEYARGFASPSGTIVDHGNRVASFEACGFNAMKTVLTMKLGDNRKEAAKNATALFINSIDKASGTNFAVKVGANADGFFGKVSAEEANIGKIVKQCSKPGDETNYVDRRSRRLLQELARDFLVPPGGVNEDNVNDVVDANLVQIRKRLGRETLSLAEMRFFTRLVEQQNWKPSFGLFSTTYDSPFKKLDEKTGDLSFLVAMHARQNDYLIHNGLEGSVLDPIDEVREQELSETFRKL